MARHASLNPSGNMLLGNPPITTGFVAVKPRSHFRTTSESKTHSQDNRDASRV
ncbi:hypothetical protein PtB15_2B456 [Puccinia triticina]|nr:hypothetical protein PtB15_2B456 [Puccinia triticina]